MWHFFWAAVSGSVVTTALLGIAAFLGRSQVAHWLNKDIEKIKAQYQRELEAYKVSLIAETERAKALQSVKTAAALRSIERKFVLLEALHKSLQGHFSSVISCVEFPYPDLPSKVATYQDCQTRVRRLAEALDEAGAHLTPQQFLVVLQFHRACNDLVSEGVHRSSLAPFPISDPRREALVHLAVAAIAVPRGILDAMTRME